MTKNELRARLALPGAVARELQQKSKSARTGLVEQNVGFSMVYLLFL